MQTGKLTAKELIADLERRIAEADPNAILSECQYAGDGEFHFKLHTATGGYLASGTAEEIVEVVKRDKAAYGKAVCPFCKQPVDIHDGYGCDHCGAFSDCDGGQLAGQLLGEHGTADEILGAICSYPTNYKATPDLHAIWASPDNKETPATLSKLVNTICGPQEAPATFQIPILLMPDNAESDEEEDRLASVEEFTEGEADSDAVRLPTCQHCIHAAHLRTHRSHGYGYYSEPDPVCVYPHTGERFEALFPEPFAYTSESGPGYTGDHGASFRNVLLGAWLENHIGTPGTTGLLVTNEQDDRTHAFIGEPFNYFHGPICPGFELDTDHDELMAEVYVPARAHVTAQMGIVDLEKRKAEERQQRYYDLLYATDRQLRTMADDPAKRRVLRARVDKASFNEKKEALLDVLSELDPEIWEMFPIWPKYLHYHLNISNSIAEELPEHMRAFLRNRKQTG